MAAGIAVRSLQRGLEVLAEVNRSGGARAGAIAQKLRLPRPTVYRLLETLESCGYVARSASDERFYVTLMARALGDGFSGGVKLSAVAAPILVELGRLLVWPVDLLVCEGGAMVIQETTHTRSPLSIDRGMVGVRMPMLRTAAGLAYLAFSPEPERRALLDYLRKLDDPADRTLVEPATLNALLSAARRRGYAVRTPSKLPIPKASATKTLSVAVPIMAGSAILGSLTIIWLANALPLSAGVTKFFRPMQAAAQAIGARYQALG